MKKFCLIALVAMASTASMAQYTTPTPRTTPETTAPKSGAMPADNAQMKSDARKDGTATMGAAGTKSGRWSAMDANGDGMVSQEEYMAYHTSRWNKMKQTNGKVSMADMEAAMSAGGPN